jgi:hypothetical protein
LQLTPAGRELIQYIFADLPIDWSPPKKPIPGDFGVADLNVAEMLKQSQLPDMAELVDERTHVGERDLPLDEAVRLGTALTRDGARVHIVKERRGSWGFTPIILRGRNA